MTRRTVLLLALCGSVALRARAGETPATAEPPVKPSPVDVIPAPRHVVLESGCFEIRKSTIVVVSNQATRGTRRAARVIQAAIRERFGFEAPIVRIPDEHRHRAALPEKTKGQNAIWVVEPRLGRSPAKTIGVEGLTFTEAMRREGYFIRVDPIEVVVHGASDAGSLYGAHTLVQLVRPGRPGSLLRRGRGPSLPSLWIRDHPARAARSLPIDITVPPTPPEAHQFFHLLAHYHLNTLHRVTIPAHPDAAVLFREHAAACQVRFATAVAKLPATPFGAIARRWADQGLAARYAVAALAEEAWGPPDPSPEAFRRRFARLVFGAEAAAEAIALTEQCFDIPVHRTVQELVRRARRLADATGDEARRYAREQRAHDRRARRIRAAWEQVKRPAALRDAFRLAAERKLAALDALYALAEARRLVARDRLKAARAALKRQVPSLRASGAIAGEDLGLFQDVIERLDAAIEARKPPELKNIW